MVYMNVLECTYVHICLLQNSLVLNLVCVSVIGLFSESQKHHFASVEIVFIIIKKLPVIEEFFPT